MEWLVSLAALPLLLCGAMCVGGMVVAFLGIRRAKQPSCHAPTSSTVNSSTADDARERV